MKSNSFVILKKQIRLFPLLLMIALLFSGCNVLELFSKARLKPSRFRQITIADKNDRVSVFTDAEKIEYYIEAFNSADQTENDITHNELSEYRVVLEGKKPKHSKEFRMYRCILTISLKTRAFS